LSLVLSDRKKESFELWLPGFALEKKLTKYILFCGGKTKEKDTEAEIMKKVLINSFPKVRINQIYLEDKSTDTTSNIENAKKLITEKGLQKIAILTCNYHLERAIKLASPLGIKAEKLSAENLLDKKYQKELEEYYQTSDMQNIIKLEKILNKLSLIDKKGVITKFVSKIIYNL
jgi:vancomycin permeability regulator SanA